MAATGTLSRVWPLGSRLDESGNLELGGCNARELAREFGTPAYIVAEDDLRARARAFAQALAERHADATVLFATKAFPCTAVLELFAGEGIGADVASGGELHMALAAGISPERIVLHGNAKSAAELEYALRERVGLIALDGFDELESLTRLAGGEQGAQRVLVRVTPDVRGDTHPAISTGQAESKFGFSLASAAEAIVRVQESPTLELVGLHVHIGSQLSELDPFRRATEAIAQLGEFAVYDLGGGLGVAYTSAQQPPTIEQYVDATVAAAHDFLGERIRLLLEPGRALVANSCVTLYRVETVKPGALTWVAVDGGMSDNLRPMLYGAPYEAEIVGRFGGATPCRVVGKHCESGDVLISDVALDEPRAGDLLVTPATGAYGHALANNYNGIPRPPVIFCKDGDARVVVRRETYDDLGARDVG